MRKPIMAGNWKMNLLRDEVARLLDGLIEGCSGVTDREILVCPAFPYLGEAAARLAGSNIQLGGQDCGWERAGAFTGVVSPAMLTDVGATHVILGHSERRHILRETDATINAKLELAIASGLKPILCAGETIDEREAGRTWAVIEGQLEGGLAGREAADCGDLVIAYEPVWAIGTGHTATPEQAEEVHAQIRAWVGTRFGADSGLADGLRILYGGSVNPKNVDALMAQPNVDGGLVGGASLKVADFVRLVRFES